LESVILPEIYSKFSNAKRVLQVCCFCRCAEKTLAQFGSQGQCSLRIYVVDKNIYKIAGLTSECCPTRRGCVLSAGLCYAL